eukprot:7303885-Ditylum_brightwellii.AAC.1
MAVHLQALGLLDNAMKTSVLLNQKAKHHIKTTSGVTEEFYQSTPDCPSFGKGQGKGKKKAERVADAYVDDTGNTYVNKENQSKETPESIKDNICHFTQTWEQLLFGSESRLCPKKTFWWIIWWVWKG